METDDLDSKKINNEQSVNEGFSKDNINKDYDPSKSILKTELETDKDGNQKTVDRARNVENPKNSEEEDDRNWNENESMSRSLKTEDLERKAVENKDRNSDITPNRYPNSNPDNSVNRGNIKLDDDK